MPEAIADTGIAMNGHLRDVVWRALPRLPVLRHQPGGRWLERDGMLLFTPGIAGAEFNLAALRRPSVALAEALALADAFFGGAAGDYGVLVEADAHPAVERELRERGWQVREEEPALVLPAIPPAPPPPTGLTIRRVNEAATLEDWLAVAGSEPDEDHEDPSAVHRAFIHSLDVACDPDIGLFVGYVAGVPVASSGLYRTDGIADIGQVVTVPEHRRRGYGAALTWAALAEGAARGCSAATLSATEMGYPMYRRMGFVPACVLREFARAG